MSTLSRYKRQLENTNSRLETELEETKKLVATRDHVSKKRATYLHGLSNANERFHYPNMSGFSLFLNETWDFYTQGCS